MKSSPLFEQPLFISLRTGQYSTTFFRRKLYKPGKKKTYKEGEEDVRQQRLTMSDHIAQKGQQTIILLDWCPYHWNDKTRDLKNDEPLLIQTKKDPMLTTIQSPMEY